MSVSLITAFVLSFAIGPLLCASLLRMSVTWDTLRTLLAITLGLVVAAMVLQPRTPLPALLMLWGGWISAMALTAQALRLRWPGPRTLRLTRIAAILATPLPWFGLATARLMA